MAKRTAKPYEEGKGFALRRRVFGQDLFVSGHASGAAAKKAMDKLVQGLQDRGKPKGFGPRKTTVAQALQDMGMERLPFMKGAKQEATVSPPNVIAATVTPLNLGTSDPELTAIVGWEGILTLSSSVRLSSLPQVGTTNPLHPLAQSSAATAGVVFKQGSVGRGSSARDAAVFQSELPTRERTGAERTDRIARLFGPTGTCP